MGGVGIGLQVVCWWEMGGVSGVLCCVYVVCAVTLCYSWGLDLGVSTTKA